MEGSVPATRQNGAMHPALPTDISWDDVRKQFAPSATDKEFSLFYVEVDMLNTLCFSSRIFKRYIFKLDNGLLCFIIYHYATVLSSTK